MTQKKAALECTKCGARNYTITVKPDRASTVVNILCIEKQNKGRFQ